MATCLTMLQLIYGGKQVRVPTNSFVLHAEIEIICGYVDPNLYYYCKGHLWSQHAEAQYLRTDTPGFCWFVLLIDSEAGRKIEETELLGQVHMYS